MNRKLKLTKLTVANLNRIKGGIAHCGCIWTNPGAAAFDNAIQHTCDTLIKEQCTATSV